MASYFTHEGIEEITSEDAQRMVKAHAALRKLGYDGTCIDNMYVCRDRDVYVEWYSGEWVHINPDTVTITDASKGMRRELAYLQIPVG